MTKKHVGQLAVLIETTISGHEAGFAPVFLDTVGGWAGVGTDYHQGVATRRCRGMVTRTQHENGRAIDCVCVCPDGRTCEAPEEYPAKDGRCCKAVMP